MNIKTLLAGLIFAASMSANAELVSIGEGSAVYDTNSGLTWSSFEKTKLGSLAVMISAMESGGELYGWRFAEADEVFDLWSENVARYDENAEADGYAVSAQERADWISLFGITYVDNRSAGYYYNPESEMWKIGGYYRDGWLEFFGENYSMDHTVHAITGQYSNAYGYYLVLEDSFEINSKGLAIKDVSFSSGILGGGSLLFLAGLHGRRKVSISSRKD